MAYNEPLEHAVEGGIVGAVLFVLIIVALLCSNVPIGQYANRAMKKDNNPTQTSNFEPGTFEQAWVAYAGICAFAVMSLVNFTLQAPPVICLFVVYAAAINPGLSAKAGKEKPSFMVRTISFPYWGKLACSLILICPALYFGIKEVNLAYAQLQNKKGAEMLRNGNITGALGVFKPLEKTLHWSETYHQNYAGALSANGNDSLALTHLVFATTITSDPDLYISTGYMYSKLGKTAEAETEFRLAMYMEPNRFAPRYALMLLYRRRSDIAMAKAVASEIVNMKPKVPSKEVEYYKREAWKMIKP
jgi:tetratricopeptide (TPR) repeat protein